MALLVNVCFCLPVSDEFAVACFVRTLANALAVAFVVPCVIAPTSIFLIPDIKSI